jgi:hypothetical protein
LPGKVIGPLDWRLAKGSPSRIDNLLLLLAVGFIAICLQQDIRKVTQKLLATIWPVRGKETQLRQS